jgi:hypothetical protein
MNVIARRGWLGCLLFVFAETAQASTIIQFQNYTPYGTLTDYGSNAPSTPDVTISYRTFVPLDLKQACAGRICRAFCDCAPVATTPCSSRSSAAVVVASRWRPFWVS